MNKRNIIICSTLIVIAVLLGSIEDFTNYMESEGYVVEQMGIGFQLQRGNESKLLT